MRRALLKSRWRTAKIATVLAAVLAALTGMGATAVSAGTTTGPWSQTSYNAAQSRANLNEQILTRTTVGKVLHLRDITPPPADTTGCSAPGIVAPVLTGGRLYAVANGRLTKYNPATGTVIWQRTPDPTFSVYFRSLAVAGGLVIVGELDCGSVSDPNGFIQAFNASTGALVWSTFITPNRNGALMQLVVSGGYVVAAGASDGGGDVVSVRKLTTGASVWYRETDYCGGGGNVLVAAQLVMSIACAQNAASLTANNLATGALAWSLASGGCSAATPMRQLAATSTPRTLTARSSASIPSPGSGSTSWLGRPMCSPSLPPGCSRTAAASACVPTASRPAAGSGTHSRAPPQTWLPQPAGCSTLTRDWR